MVVSDAGFGRNRERYAVGRMLVSAVTMKRTLEVLHEQVKRNQSEYVCVSNVRTTMLAQKDDDFCRIQNKSLLTVPDGMPLVWIAKVAGVGCVERITGYSLMAHVFASSVQNGYSHYFLGDTEATLVRLNAIVQDRYSGIDVRGSFSPPFRNLTDLELLDIADQINRVKPSFVWVALGAPKQERFMAQLVERLHGPIMIGVGAAFRSMVGEYPCAPPWAQACGLEGVFWRFRKNPVREGWWYCRHIPPVVWFLGAAVRQRIRGAP